MLFKNPFYTFSVVSFDIPFVSSVCVSFINHCFVHVYAASRRKLTLSFSCACNLHFSNVYFCVLFLHQSDLSSVVIVFFSHCNFFFSTTCFFSSSELLKQAREKRRESILVLRLQDSSEMGNRRLCSKIQTCPICKSYFF